MIRFFKSLFNRNPDKQEGATETLPDAGGNEAPDNSAADASSRQEIGGPCSADGGHEPSAAPTEPIRVPSVTLLSEGKWQIFGISITGEAHLDDDTPSEDSFYATETLNGFLVAVVSDGAGSAANAQWASRTICESFIGLSEGLSKIEVVEGLEAAEPEQGKSAESSEIGESGDDTVEEPPRLLAELCTMIRDHLARTREVLLAQAKIEAAHQRDFLATVVAVIAHPELGVVTAHIGDGTATLFDDDAQEIFTSQPENGEYLNETYFLIQDEWEEHLRFRLLPQTCREIFLMSDGVTDLGYTRDGRKYTPSSKFIGPISAYLASHSSKENEQAVTRILDNQKARALVNDDKTLVWARLR